MIGDRIDETMRQAASELNDAVEIFLYDLLDLRPGESLLIYEDGGTDEKVSRAIEARANLRPVRTTVLRLQAGATLERQVQQLAAAVRSARFHAVCELSEQYFYHTQAWRAATKSGARIFSVGGLDEPAFIRCVGKVDHARMFAMGARLQRILQGSDQIHIRTAKGSDIRMRLKHGHGRDLFGRLIGRPRPYVIGPCGRLSPAAPSTFLGGQLAFLPDPETIDGTAVIDGYLWPPAEAGKLDTPVVLRIRQGKLAGIEGDSAKSAVLRKWFANRARHLWIEHFCLGFHPCATLGGKLLEAERTYGSITVGMGKRALHSDGVMTQASLFAGGVAILEGGVFVGEDLASQKHGMLRP